MALGARKNLIYALNGEMDSSDFGIYVSVCKERGYIKSRKNLNEGEDYNSKYNMVELEIYVDDNFKETRKGTIKVVGDKIRRCPKCNKKIVSKLITANPYRVLYRCENKDCDYEYFEVD